MNCPHCDRLLYSRQHRACGFCGEELPAEYRLSEPEIASLKAEQQAMEERRAREKAKAEEEKRQKAIEAARLITLQSTMMQ